MTQLSEQQQERYVRNLLVEDFTPEQQEKLLNGRVLVIGAGGLGSAVLHYLAAAGIGRLGIADSDIVSLSNLQRQVLYTEKDLGHPKAECAARKVKLINSDTNTDVYNSYITVENASQIIKKYDLTIDCSDNYPTRYLVDKICREFSIPFIYGSAEQTITARQVPTATFSRKCPGHRNPLSEYYPPYRASSVPFRHWKP